MNLVHTLLFLLQSLSTQSILLHLPEASLLQAAARILALLPSSQRVARLLNRIPARGVRTRHHDDLSPSPRLPLAFRSRRRVLIPDTLITFRAYSKLSLPQSLLSPK